MIVNSLNGKAPHPSYALILIWDKKYYFGIAEEAQMDSVASRKKSKNFIESENIIEIFIGNKWLESAFLKNVQEQPKNYFLFR